MKWSGVIATLVVSWDCIEYAVGIEPQHFFAPDMIWLWWIPAILWFMGSIGFLLSEEHSLPFGHNQFHQRRSKL